VTYLPKDYGFSITFDIDGYVFINETLSGRISDISDAIIIQEVCLIKIYPE
jgi:hypothetical protein